MKHTKGPWRVSPDMPTQVEVNVKQLDKINYEANLLCETDNEYDAQLIAAAPEMLEVLQKAVSILCPLPSFDQLDSNLEEDEMILKMLEVIKKARGD